MKQKRGTYDSVGIAASTFTAVGSNIPHSYQPLFEGLLNFTAQKSIQISTLQCPSIAAIYSSGKGQVICGHGMYDTEIFKFSLWKFGRSLQYFLNKKRSSENFVRLRGKKAKLTASLYSCTKADFCVKSLFINYSVCTRRCSMQCVDPNFKFDVF